MGEAEIINFDRSRRAPLGPPRPQPKVRCRASTATGRPCRNYATTDDGYCNVHANRSARDRHPSGTGSTGTIESEVSFDEPGGVEAWVRKRLKGDYPIDDFGYDPELARNVLLPLAKPLYEKYFRVQTLGVERIPDDSAALLVGNHSGTVAIDAVMVQYAVATEHPMERPIRNIGADLVYSLPFVGPLARKAGNAVACDEDALELLRRGELVGVYPEGYKGVGKGWKERYKLQRFGRGGFIQTALRARVPIIPVAVVGAEETYPMIGNSKLLARLFGAPYFPITPTFPLLGPLGLIPLPSRWIIEFGEPIPMDDYPEDAAEDAMLVFDLSDRIRDTIQQMIYKLLARRRSAFF
jgi:1-acyl-sn-glycerol-3-phosphate acyltransferase